VFLRLVVKMSDYFLEKRTNMEFCVKLERNASDTHCSLRLMGENVGKSQVFLNGIDGSK
jgi:hypothetical protein